jgi:hypothetical protein
MNDQDRPYDDPVTPPSTPDDLRDALSWIDDVEIVGDGPDGPYRVLRDGTVIDIEVPEAPED